MPHTRRRPAETGRGDGRYADTLGGHRDDTTADNLAVERLPPPTRVRYLAACHRWRFAYYNHRAIRRLIEVRA